ncbi:MAG TPA: hypothetical protein VI636_17145 [Candidatus Angelobacter sp.]
MELLLRFRRLDIVADAVRLLIPWGSAVAIVGLLAFMVSRLAGKMTLAQIGMSFFGDIRVSQAVAYMFGILGGGYGLLERRLRHRKTKNMAGHMAELEKKIDPGRTSSGLDPKGTTRKGE